MDMSDLKKCIGGYRRDSVYKYISYLENKFSAELERLLENAPCDYNSIYALQKENDDLSMEIDRLKRENEQLKQENHTLSYYQRLSDELIARLDSKSAASTNSIEKEPSEIAPTEPEYNLSLFVKRKELAKK